MGDLRIEPDVTFIKSVLGRGGDSLKKCYQCATCSVVCELSPDEAPFPRKEMIWTQWGLKDRVLADPHIWLCHACNDCTVHCPRGAKPSEVLAALRNLAIEHYSLPHFMGRMVLRPGYLPLLVIIPVLIIGLALWLFGNLNPGGDEIIYAEMFPHAPLNTLFTGLSLLAFLGVLIGAVRLWTDMNASGEAGNPGIRVPLSARSVVQAAREILFHSRFAKCGTERLRFFSHLLVVAGFIGLLITTVAAIVSILLFHLYPFPQSNPFKILGNVSALMLIVGLIMMIAKRLAGRKPQLSKGTYFDWFLLTVLLGVVLTGAACEVLRLAFIPSIAYPMYFIHMVLIFFLLIYAPYSKFAHVIYRAVAMTHELAADRVGRPVSATEKSAEGERPDQVRSTA